jgi:ribosomal protein L13E
LSSKPKKKSERKEPDAKVKEAPSPPSGKAPEAWVSSRRRTEMVSRLGRGFSSGELSSAGLAPGLASKWGLRVDYRRRSVLEGNVKTLKGWGGQLAPPKKPEGRAKKIEEEIGKVEKEVEKEAVEIKKEVVKVERAAKKEASKAEKAVKAKVEKPKKQQSKKKKPGD